ncbi:MAG TPA: lipoyl(octanoyl) transferase LipB [Gammaproteobacteria bacterium]|nr:lipoyl(octanoyl) transferase LipB [Gammaproteobacteria bacterium]
MTNLIIRTLGLMPYDTTWQLMKAFTHQRTLSTPDEFWLVEHFPVFTQGQAGKPEHLLNPGTIPIIQSDRGGQVTYHGPGQLVMYVLINLKRKNLGVKLLITHLEHAIISLLAQHNILGTTQIKAPGVYVNQCKIASLGLRVHRGCSYHGVSLNVSMDLEPFSRINPCGYPNLKVVQMRDFNHAVSTTEVASQLITHLMQQLDYGLIAEKVEGF